MTKIEDIPLEERWPTLNRLVPKLFIVACIWIGYQGIALVASNGGWPLTLPFSQPTLESYQQYVASAQQSQQVAHWVLGPVFIFASAFILRRPMRRLIRRMLNRRTEEVQIEK